MANHSKQPEVLFLDLLDRSQAEVCLPVIIRSALEGRSQVEPELRRMLDRVIERIRIPGFREPARAPTSVLVNKVLQLCDRNRSLIGPWATVWAASMVDLRTEARTFLIDKRFAQRTEHENLSDEEHRVDREWFQAAAGEYLAASSPHQDVSTDVRLAMLAYAYAELLVKPVPEERGLTVQGTGGDKQALLSGPVWERTLEALRALPDEASEWGEIDRFIATVQALAAERQVSRREREEVRHLFERLKVDHVEALRFFGWEEWSCGDFIAGHEQTLPEIRQAIGRFSAAIAEHEQVRTTVSRTLGEERKRRSRTAELEDELVALQAKLSAFVRAKTPAEGAEDKPAPLTTSVSTKDITGGDLPAMVDGTTVEPDARAAPTAVGPIEGALDPIPLEERLPSYAARESEGEPASFASESAGADGPVAEAPEGVLPRLELTADGGDDRPLADPEADPAASTDGDLMALPESVRPAIATVPQGIGGPRPPVDGSEPLPPDRVGPAADVPVAPSGAEALWDLIDRDDLSGAYWIVRSLEATSDELPLAPWLVAAAQGARWAPTAGEAVLADLAAISLHHTPAEGEVARLIGLSAALCPILTSPGTGFGAWIEGIDGRLSSLRPLAETLLSFSHHGIVVRTADLHGVVDQARLAGEIAEAVRAAKQWADDAPRIGTHYQRASDVLRFFLGPDGELREMIDIVIGDRRREYARCLELVARWGERSTMDAAINEYHRRRKDGRPRPIEGHAYQRLIDHVSEGRRRARRWAELVDQAAVRQDRGDWVAGQIKDLVEGVRAALPDVVELLHTLEQLERPMTAAVRCLERSIWQSCELLGLPLPKGLAEPLSYRFAFGDDSLRAGLAQRLLWLPGLSLRDDGEPEPTEISSLAGALRAAIHREQNPETATKGWLQVQDYRFVEDLLRLVTNEKQREVLAREYNQQRLGSRATLKDERGRTKEEIEHALLDGIISESDRTALVSRVGDTESENLMSVLNFRREYRRLEEIQADLKRARQERLDAQRRDWLALQERIVSALPEDGQRQQLLNHMDAVFERRDTRVVDEWLSQIRQRVDQGNLENPDWISPGPERDPLIEFLEDLQRFSESADGLALRELATRLGAEDTRPLPPILGRIRSLEPGRRKEVAQALHAWLLLKAAPGVGTPKTESLGTVLRFLGYSLTRGAPTALQPQTRARDWVHLRADAKSGGLSPVPQFGSQDDGHLDLVCLWEWSSVDALGARLQELRLHEHNVLVLYFGRLLPRQRLDLLNYCRLKGLAIVVLDELLLAFLAGEVAERLPVFLQCALPFASVMPFTPFKAGDVPPEMFRGRAEMRRSLQSLEDRCVVYGGRQLGKSALLRQVAREFDDPARNQYAILEDIRLIGDPRSGQPAENLWRRLRDRLIDLGLLNKSGSEKPEQVLRQLGEAMAAQDRRLLVLLDEADKFLDADAQQGFKIVAELKNLMERTGRRFKLVLAGLHGVQRFHKIPNQPLAHLSAPLQVGPLEAKAALRLVHEPLRALGFRFATDGLGLRILSHTNYHPGLIQLFCYELVKRLHKKSATRLPPYEITKEDVEAVYRTPQVRKEIKDRFDWTIALDRRYQAITWTLIFDQLETYDGYSESFDSATIHQKAHAWWPQGFNPFEDGEFRGLLEELCGLGVLVGDHAGRYCLRGPNLVRLVGNEADILAGLQALENYQPPVELDQDRHHAPLNDAATRYSPLTYAQERLLNPMRFGVGLLFASQALGFDDLEAALDRFIPQELWVSSSAHRGELPLVDAQQTTDFLGKYLTDHNDAKRLMLVHRVHGGSLITADQIEAALRFCSNRVTSERRWLRVFFLFDAASTLSWCFLPKQRRDSLEARADGAVWPSRWTLVGIKQLLEQRQMMDSEEACRVVLEATSGWPLLLSRLSTQWSGSDNPREAADAFGKDLLDPVATPRPQLLEALGLLRGVPMELFALLDKLDGTKQHEVPDIAGMIPVLTDVETCQAGIDYLLRLGLLEKTEEKLIPERIARQVARQL